VPLREEFFKHPLVREREKCIILGDQEETLGYKKLFKVLAIGARIPG